MNEPTILFLDVFAGAFLGVIFFGGLWWTVFRGLPSDKPALWFFLSFIIRTGVVLFGIYFLAQGDFRRLMASLAGFIIARFILNRLLQNAKNYAAKS